MKVSLSYDHWSLRKWRIKVRMLLGFCEKRILTNPIQLGVLGRTSVEPITPGPSRRDRVLGAVAQWQLRRFFCQNVTFLCISKFRLFFFKPFSPRQFKLLKTEPQLNALSDHVRRFRKVSARAILLASKTRFLRKFLGFFPILRNFTT